MGGALRSGSGTICRIDRKRRRKYTVDDRHSLFLDVCDLAYELCDVLLHLQFMRDWLLLAERHLMLRLFGAMVRGLRK
jgi:hypothetical protein